MAIILDEKEQSSTNFSFFLYLCLFCHICTRARYIYIYIYITNIHIFPSRILSILRYYIFDIIYYRYYTIIHIDTIDTIIFDILSIQCIDEIVLLIIILISYYISRIIFQSNFYSTNAISWKDTVKKKRCILSEEDITLSKKIMRFMSAL